MRLIALSAALVLAAQAGAPRVAAAAQSRAIVISDVTVVDVRTGDTRKSDILLEGDRIVRITPPRSHVPPAGARVIDAAGRYAIPGLWDMHLHLTAAPEMGADRVLTLLLANGVTSVRDMGGDLDAVLALRGRGNDETTAAPRVHVAGPVIDGIPPVHVGRDDGNAPHGSVTAATPEEAIRIVDRLADRGVDFIKAYEMLRPEVLTALVKRAHERHLLVTAHVPLRMTTIQALDAGLDGIEHIRGMEFDCAENPQELLAERVKIMDEHADENGAVLRRRVHATVRPGAYAHQDPARCAALIQRFATQGTWHTPTLHIVAFRVLRYYERPEWKDALRYLPASLKQIWQDRLTDYTDPTHYLEWKDQGEWALRMVGEMYRAGVRLMAGTDSPGLIFMPGFSLHDELDALVRAGLPPLAALQAATLTPPQFFGEESDLGTIDVGKRADIVLLDANPLLDIDNTRRIDAVILKGRVYDRSALDAMLAQFDTRH